MAVYRAESRTGQRLVDSTGEPVVHPGRPLVSGTCSLHLGVPQGTWTSRCLFSWADDVSLSVLCSCRVCGQLSPPTNASSSDRVRSPGSRERPGKREPLRGRLRWAVQKVRIDLICTAAAWPRHDPDDVSVSHVLPERHWSANQELQERPRVSQCCFASMPTHLTGPDVQPRADTRR